MSEAQAHPAKVHFDIPNELTPQFADVSFATHSDSDFRLSFYATVIPAYGPGQVQDTVTEGDQHFAVVHAKCVAQIILTPEHARTFLEALQKNYVSFIATKSEGREIDKDAE